MEKAKPVELEVLELTPAVIDALDALQDALRKDTRLYHELELFLRRLQRAPSGPLTALLAALVGAE